MRISAAVRVGLVVGAFLDASAVAGAQRGSGDGFLFAAPRVNLTFHGGVAQPLARSDLFSFTTDELTLGRSDFRSGNFGLDLATRLSPRTELVIGFDWSRSDARSEFRDWVDNNNLPIEQSTFFSRTPFTVNLRYFLADRGQQVGSLAWIPARVVPFVGVGAGLIRYQFEQAGDFIDTGTLNVYADRLTAEGWSSALQASAGAQWNLNQRLMLTGEVRYLNGSGDPGRPSGDFVGYKLDLSSVTTLLGITLRL